MSWANLLCDPKVWEKHLDENAFYRDRGCGRTRSLHTVYAGRLSVIMTLTEFGLSIEMDRCYLNLKRKPIFSGHRVIATRERGLATRFHSIEISIPYFTPDVKEGVVTMQSSLWSISIDLNNRKPMITTDTRLSEEDRMEARKILLDVSPLADDPYERIDPVWVFLMNERYSHA